MPRVIGIDPGTVSIDVCGLEDGRVFLEQSTPTADALRDPDAFVAQLLEHQPLDLVAGPSGYGLPLTPLATASDAQLRLAFLAGEGDRGGIGGLRGLARALARSGLPVVLTPGVIHLPSVPEHRKVNRVDMGTSDKVCAAALAIVEQSDRRGYPVGEVSLILVELGGAFTAGIAVENGRIVDGIGGSSGPLGLRAAGSLDGEVAFLAGRIEKGTIFTGGALSVRGEQAAPEEFARPRTANAQLAWDAYMEGVVKLVAELLVSVPSPREIVLSGRVARVDAVRLELTRRLAALGATRPLAGIGASAKRAAQGAAIVADGLAGGQHARLVDHMGIRAAHGSALDHLYVISAEAARQRLGITDAHERIGFVEAHERAAARARGEIADLAPGYPDSGGGGLESTGGR